MADRKIKLWTVTINGEITVEAQNPEKAITKAKALFADLETGISWTFTESQAYVEIQPTPVTPA